MAVWPESRWERGALWVHSGEAPALPRVPCWVHGGGGRHANTRALWSANVKAPSFRRRARHGTGSWASAWSFWACRFGVGPENLHFLCVSRQLWPIWGRSLYGEGAGHSFISFLGLLDHIITSLVALFLIFFFFSLVALNDTDVSPFSSGG